MRFPIEAPGRSRARFVARVVLEFGATLAAAAIVGPAFVHAEQPATAIGSVLEGTIVHVVDGDTVDLSHGRETTRVRLSEIDAPESAQPYGGASTTALRELVGGRHVRVVAVDFDRYGRLVGEIYRDGLYVNGEMVRRGHAWAYTRYARTIEIIELEDEARAASRGLWRLPTSEREPPWEWRRAQRRVPARTTPGESAEPNAPIRCGSKHLCSEMTSCAEARGYLSQCGLERLDRDRDGIPCESLCVSH